MRSNALSQQQRSSCSNVAIGSERRDKVVPYPYSPYISPLIEVEPQPKFGDRLFPKPPQWGTILPYPDRDFTGKELETNLTPI